MGCGAGLSRKPALVAKAVHRRNSIIIHRVIIQAGNDDARVRLGYLRHRVFRGGVKATRGTLVNNIVGEIRFGIGAPAQGDGSIPCLCHQARWRVGRSLVRWGGAVLIGKVALTNDVYCGDPVVVGLSVGYGLIDEKGIRRARRDDAVQQGEGW